jgi:hypothetical protein
MQFYDHIEDIELIPKVINELPRSSVTGQKLLKPLPAMLTIWYWCSTLSRC